MRIRRNTTNILLLSMMVLTILLGRTRILEAANSTTCVYGNQIGDTCECFEGYKGHPYCKYYEEGSYCVEIIKERVPTGIIAREQGQFVINNTLYKVGGMDSANTFMSYENGAWSHVALTSGTVTSIYGQQCVAWKNNGYCYGGMEAGGVQDTFFIFNYTQVAWEQYVLNGANVQPVVNAAVELVGNFMWMLSGDIDENVLTPNIRAVNLEDLAFHTITEEVTEARRNAISAVVPGNSILFYGGTGASSTLTNLEQFNATTEVSTAVTTQGVEPSARAGGQGIYYKNYFYMMGGMDGNGNSLKDIYKLDITSLKWHKAPIELPETNNGFKMSLLMDPYVFIGFGGQDTNGNTLNSVFIMDLEVCDCQYGYTGDNCNTKICYGIPETGNVCSNHGTCVGPDECVCEIDHQGPQCERLIQRSTCNETLNSITTGTPIPSERKDPVLFSEGQHIYMFGGRNNGGLADGFYKLNPSTLSWSSVDLQAGSEPTPLLHGFQCTHYKNAAYCSGGIDQYDIFNENLYRFLYTEETWKHFPIGITHGYAASFIHNNNWYITGGSNNGSITDGILKVNMDEFTISILDNFLTNEKENHVAVKYNETIGFIYGGRYGMNYYDDIDLLNLKTDTVSSITSGNPIDQTFNGQAIAHGNYILFFGLQRTTRTNVMFKLNMETFIWSSFTNTLPNELSNVGAIQHQLNIYIFGGVDSGSFFFNTLFKIDLMDCDCNPQYSSDDCSLTTCGNIQSDNTTYVCANHGSCVDFETCSCVNAIYTGNYCDEWSCYGINNSMGACNGNGNCVDQDQCACNANYFGANCSITLCDNIASNETNVCHGHGQCTATDHCLCESGYTGSTCQNYTCGSLDSFHPDVCSAHGACVAYNVCNCELNYDGNTCQTYSCFGISPTNETVCSGRGNCSAANLCTCDVNYSGDQCTEYTCFNTHYSEPTVCNGHGSCQSHDECVCVSPYIGNSCGNFSCFGVNNVNETCSGHGSCVSQDECVCTTPYFGENCDQFTCYGINQTDTLVCSGNGNCTALDQCVCSDGFSGTTCASYSCFNLSSTNPQVCSVHGECTGPNQCSCYSSYTGVNCQLPTCFGTSANSSGVCNGHGACTSPDHCQCDQYYSGNDCTPYSCNDVEAYLPSTCSGHGSCLNQNNCSCDEGYSGNNCNSFSCYGFHKTHPMACFGHGSCNAANICQCQLDYIGSDCSNYTCFNVNYDNPLVCSGHGTCQDVNNCTCQQGYEDDMCGTTYCFGIENKDDSVCSSHGTCTNVDECSCAIGYTDYKCHVPVCYGISAKSTTTCSGHGQCKGPNNCICQNEYLFSANCSTLYNPLVVDIKGGSRQVTKLVTLDGSNSFSLNAADPIANYTWQCTPLQNETTCPTMYNTKTFQTTFNESGSFKLTLLIHLQSGYNESRSVQLDIKENFFVEFYLEADSPFISSDQSLGIYAIGAGDLTKSVSFKWSYATSTTNFTSIDSTQIEGDSTNTPNVFFLPNQFKNTSYVDIQCVIEDDWGNFGINTKRFTFITPPQISNVIINPINIVDSTQISVAVGDRCEGKTCHFSISLVKDDAPPLDIIYASTNSNLTIYFPRVKISQNATIIISVKDKYGLKASVERQIQFVAANSSLTLKEKLNNLGSLDAKTSLTLLHVQTTSLVNENDANLILDVMDALEESPSNSYLRSIALRNMKNGTTSLKNRVIDSAELCLKALKVNNSTRFDKLRNTAANLLDAFSNSLDKSPELIKNSTSNVQRIHDNVHALSQLVDANIYLGEAPFRVSNDNMNISLTKVLPGTMATKKIHDDLTLPTNIGNAISKQFTKPLSSKFGLTVIMNQLNYVPPFNQTQMNNTTPSSSLQLNQTIELSFTNAKDTYNLTNLEEPLSFTFQNIPKNGSVSGSYYVPKCTYYNTTTGKWSTNGCYFKAGMCHCNHTTLFSIDLSLILPQFNLLDFEKHSITKLNADNMTVTLILAGILFGYGLLLCLFQLLDILTGMISKIQFKIQPNMPIGYIDASGHKHFVIPIFQRLRDIHQWISVILSPNTPDRSYSKQQRLTVLLILILGIMMSNALTVGIGADNESIYVTACIVADLLIQPFALLAAFLFCKIKPRETKKKVSVEAIEDKDFSAFVDNYDSLRKMKYQLELLENDDDDENNLMLSASWKMLPCNLKVTSIFLLKKINANTLLLFGANDNKMVFGTYNMTDGGWNMRSCSSEVLPALVSEDKGQFLHVEARHSIYFIVASSTTNRLDVMTFDLASLTWKNTMPLSTIPHFHDVGCCVHGNNIYCFGGRSFDGTPLNDLVFYDTLLEQWKQVNLSRMSAKPSPRNNALLASHKYGLYIIGGENHADVFFFNESMNAFELVTDQLNVNKNISFVQSLDDNLLLVSQENKVDISFQNALDGKVLNMTISNMEEAPQQVDQDHEGIFYSSYLHCLTLLDDIHVVKKEEALRDELIQKLEIEHYVAKQSTSRLVRDLGISFFDKVLAHIATFFQKIDIKKFGIVIIFLATLVYFAVLAVGCYIMVYVNWLGVIGTTTYGVMGLLTYLTLLIQLYIQSKRKVYLEDEMPYRSRLTYVAVIALVFGSIITLFAGFGTVFGLSYIESETDRVGVMLIMSIFFIGLISNMLRLAFHLVWAPARSKNKFISLLERPWFPNWFKYPIFVICWAEIGVMCWILIMFSIKFHEDNMTPDWLIACGFGNSQNFFLDQTLVFITTTFVMTTVLQFFEALIRPRHGRVIVLTDEDDVTTSEASSFDLIQDLHPTHISTRKPMKKDMVDDTQFHLIS